MQDLKPENPNILHEPLVDRKKIIFPPLHIKLGLMKQFVKSSPTDGDCFKYIILHFPGKIKAGVFDGPQIRQLIKDEQFTETLRRMLGYHSKMMSRTFLVTHVQVITQKLFRNY